MKRHVLPQMHCPLAVTGQRQRNHKSIVIPEGVPIVRTSQLTRHTSSINDSQLSGKREGMIVAVTAPDEGTKRGLWLSTGSNDSDKWIQISTAADSAYEEFAAEEIDDAVDVELGSLFYEKFNLAETSQKIQTKVIQTPVRTLDGSFAYRCRLTTYFMATPKQDVSIPTEVMFSMKLLNTTGGVDQHNIIDHAVFQPFVTIGMVLGAVEVHSATTNSIPVRMHFAEGSSGAITFQFVFEWTSTYDLLE